MQPNAPLADVYMYVCIYIYIYIYNISQIEYHRVRIITNAVHLVVKHITYNRRVLHDVSIDVNYNPLGGIGLEIFRNVFVALGVLHSKYGCTKLIVSLEIVH